MLRMAAREMHRAVGRKVELQRSAEGKVRFVVDLGGELRPMCEFMTTREALLWARGFLRAYAVMMVVA